MLLPIIKYEIELSRTDFPSFNSNTVEYILQTVTVRSVLTRTENTQAKSLKTSENILQNSKGR